MIRFGTLLLTCFLILAACATKKDVVALSEWRPLFNGKDLTGWIPKIRGYEVGDNFANTFRVEDGLIKVRYDGYDQFSARYGHLFHQEIFGTYRLRVEYRVVGEQANGGEAWATKNSGVMIHGQPAHTMLKDQDFPISIEVQILGGITPGVARPTANLCTPGTEAYMKDKRIEPHCTNAAAPTFYGEEWVILEIDVTPEAIIHYVNGQEVMRYHSPEIGGGVVNGYDTEIKKDGMPISSGSISLQSESHPIDFRRVDIKPYK